MCFRWRHQARIPYITYVRTVAQRGLKKTKKQVWHASGTPSRLGTAHGVAAKAANAMHEGCICMTRPSDSHPGSRTQPFLHYFFKLTSQRCGRRSHKVSRRLRNQTLVGFFKENLSSVFGDDAKHLEQLRLTSLPKSICSLISTRLLWIIQAVHFTLLQLRIWLKNSPKNRKTNKSNCLTKTITAKQQRLLVLETPSRPRPGGRGWGVNVRSVHDDAGFCLCNKHSMCAETCFYFLLKL